MARKLIDRFRSFALPRLDSDCWSWNGNKHKQGYGKIHVDGKTELAHRVSYELFNGPASGYMVCHKCDNPECTNPEHLFLGCAMDNMQDKISKGRHRGARKGSRHHLSKLTEFNVQRIREMYSSGKMNQYQLAEKFGVCQAEISHIVNLKKWSHVV